MEIYSQDDQGRRIEEVVDNGSVIDEEFRGELSALIFAAAEGGKFSIHLKFDDDFELGDAAEGVKASVAIGYRRITLGSLESVKACWIDRRFMRDSHTLAEFSKWPVEGRTMGNAYDMKCKLEHYSIPPASGRFVR